VAHTLGVAPTDILVTLITGGGSLTINWGQCTSSQLSLSASGACRARFLVGSQWENPPSKNFATSDAQTFASTSGVGAAGATGSTGAAGTTGSAGSSTLPSGIILPFAGVTLPTGGYLFCDGTVYPQASYTTLFAAIGTAYNTGSEGSGNFRVPDLRGIFPRGAGTNGQLTESNSGSYSATLGAYQKDQMQGHEHGVNDPTHTHTPNKEIGGGTFGTASGNWASDGAGSSPVTANGPVLVASSTGVTVTTPTSDGTNGTPLTGAETRPANVGVNYIIKI
jgi:microcystin-dependent protein